MMFTNPRYMSRLLAVACRAAGGAISRAKFVECFAPGCGPTNGEITDAMRYLVQQGNFSIDIQPGDYIDSRATIIKIGKLTPVKISNNPEE